MNKKQRTRKHARRQHHQTQEKAVDRALRVATEKGKGQEEVKEEMGKAGYILIGVSWRRVKVEDKPKKRRKKVLAL